MHIVGACVWMVLRYRKGRHGSVVVCTTYKQEIGDSIPSWAELCSDIVLLGKAFCPHVHSLDPGVSGYLVGQ